jgi:hypothetical protein
MAAPKYEMFNDGGRKGEKPFIKWHLNFEYRYEITNEHVTGERDVWFFPVQIRPGKRNCENDTCPNIVCNIPEDESTEDILEWTQYYTDPVAHVKEGYRVKTNKEGVVMMEPPDELEQGIDLNWCRLCNMAQPIVDEQLGRLAMNQNWKDTPMKLKLGALYADMSVVRIDKASYSEMSPNGNATDRDEIKKAWKASMVKAKQMPGKKQKQNKFSDMCGRTYRSFGSARKEEEKEKKNKVAGKKKGVEVSDPVIKFKKVPEAAGEEEEDGYTECCAKGVFLV